MEQYRAGEVRLLVATDVASRGLDVKDIAYVINYDFPVDGVEVSTRCPPLRTIMDKHINLSGIISRCLMRHNWIFPRQLCTPE